VENDLVGMRRLRFSVFRAHMEFLFIAATAPTRALCALLVKLIIRIVLFKENSVTRLWAEPEAIRQRPHRLDIVLAPLKVDWIYIHGSRAGSSRARRVRYREATSI